MKKPTLSDALTPKPADITAPVQQPEATVAPPRLTDRRTATSVRIEPDKLDELKMLAVRRRVKVNDLILQGIDHVLALGRQTPGRAA
jgi:hypothetical protein